MCNLLVELGDMFGRLMEYEILISQATRFENSLFKVFGEFLNFARQVHGVFKNAKRSMLGR